MFTFYGDGSRVGLPSLEVPIEAYPGIPLRSDRLRARRRARRSPGFNDPRWSTWKYIYTCHATRSARTTATNPLVLV